MPQYTQAELQAMSPEQFAAAREDGFEKPPTFSGTPVEEVVEFPSARPYSSTLPAPFQPSPPQYGGWNEEKEFDFRTSGGKLCRMRQLGVKELAKAGILDRVTRLQGLADKLVQAAEGTPPKADAMTSEDVTLMADMLETLVPLAVMIPRVMPIPSEGGARLPGVVYVDSIPFNEQVEIGNRAMAGLADFDSFRE